MAHTLTEAQMAQALIPALLEFRAKIDPEMPVQQLLTFLITARTPGITMQDAMKELDISSASISRNVSALSRINRFHQPGHELLQATEDPMERRRKVLELTTHGKQFAKRVAEIFNKQMQIIEKRGGA